MRGKFTINATITRYDESDEPVEAEVVAEFHVDGRTVELLRVTDDCTGEGITSDLTERQEEELCYEALDQL